MFVKQNGCVKLYNRKFNFKFIFYVQGYMPGKKEGVPSRSGIERVDIVDYPVDLEYFDSPQV